MPLRKRLVGIRAEESSKRANRSQIAFIPRYGIWHYKPLFTWKTWEIWEYIDRYQLPYCKLYDGVLDRLGCVVCPMLTYRKHQIQKELWPKTYYVFERVMKKLWLQGKKNGEPWREKTFEEFLENWYRGN